MPLRRCWLMRRKGLPEGGIGLSNALIRGGNKVVLVTSAHLFEVLMPLRRCAFRLAGAAFFAVSVFVIYVLKFLAGLRFTIGR